MWVVKVGGSLAHSEELSQWLDVIATAGAGKAVLVPGGGPWADEVREAQKREGFDDRVAHRKALRAMEQYGRLLATKRTEFLPAESIPAIRAALEKNKVAVWMPYEMVVADPLIPENWNVTSDSLAAWLADKLNATALLLVKSIAIGELQPTVEDMVRRGWVDPAFPQFTSSGRFRIRVLGQGDQKTAGQILASDTLIGVPIPY